MVIVFCKKRKENKRIQGQQYRTLYAYKTTSIFINHSMNELWIMFPVAVLFVVVVVVVAVLVFCCSRPC